MSSLRTAGAGGGPEACLCVEWRAAFWPVAFSRFWQASAALRVICPSSVAIPVARADAVRGVSCTARGARAAKRM
eukprot:1918123-Lingulodinium_polyedra.AAC.1